MHWTEPATADDSHAALEKKLWDAANMLWAGADLKPSEYSPTVLGLIFLRYADVRFAVVEKELKPQAGARRKIGATDYHAAGVIYLPENARFAELLSLPEGANTGQSINDAMRAIEKENPDLAEVPNGFPITFFGYGLAALSYRTAFTAPGTLKRFFPGGKKSPMRWLIHSREVLISPSCMNVSPDSVLSW